MDKIHIKPSKRGSLHSALGVAKNKLIPDKMISSALSRNPSPAMKKKLVFAENAKKWGKVLIFLPFLLISHPAKAVVINGFDAVTICDATVSPPNCTKPNADGSFSSTTTATGIFSAATVGTSSAQVLAAGVANKYLLFHNPSAAGGNTVYCREGATAVVAAAGNLSIAPGQYVTMESSLVDGGVWNCIATGASTPFTYGAK